VARISAKNSIEGKRDLRDTALEFGIAALIYLGWKILKALEGIEAELKKRDRI